MKNGRVLFGVGTQNFSKEKGLREFSKSLNLLVRPAGFEPAAFSSGG